MIFDDIGSSPSPDGAPASRRRSRQRPETAPDAGDSSRRRRRRSRSSFKTATELPAHGGGADRSHIAWLWVLGLLVVVALGFAWYLHGERAAPRILSGGAPSAALLPYIDPVLAPLETGEAGCSPETLSELAGRFRAGREKANLDDKDIFGTAAVMAEILEEALLDRMRHMDSLIKIGSPVQGVEAKESAPAVRDTERRHLEAAVGVSWQRNAGAYRDRIEELWMRLVRLERGRFHSAASAPAAAPFHNNP